MAFCIENLSVLAYSSGFTLWLYRSADDNQSVVASSHFFQEAGDMLNSGDMVMISALDGSRILSVLMDKEGVRTMSVV